MGKPMKVVVIDTVTPHAKAMVIALSRAFADMEVAVMNMGKESAQLRQASELAVKEVFNLCKSPEAKVAVPNEHANAQAPAFYINKNNHTIAPHKKRGRGKFKRK